jgi:large subunit ribosomal protein L38e
MPKEIFNSDEFLELSKIAFHCRVNRSKENVKLKLRTKKYLYTFKTDFKTAEDLLNKLECQVIEL